MPRIERARAPPGLRGEKVHRHHSARAQVVSSQIEASTVLVWIDGAWSGEPVSCKTLFAGAARLKNHAIGRE